MLRLNLGCGNQALDGFCNVDMHDGKGVDLACDITLLRFFDSGTVDAIYSAHALQCLPDRALVPVALSHWFRVLRPDGACNIEVPNSKPLLRDYIAGRAPIESLIQGMYGVNVDGLRQTICFDWPYLRLLLEQAGFVDIHEGPQACYSRHDARTNLVVYCRKP